MGVAAYNRSSQALSRQISDEQAEPCGLSIKQLCDLRTLHDNEIAVTDRRASAALADLERARALIARQRALIAVLQDDIQREQKSNRYAHTLLAKMVRDRSAERKAAHAATR
jgi:hypothetical protein